MHTKSGELHSESEFQFHIHTRCWSDFGIAGDKIHMVNVTIVIVNFRTPQLVVDCLASLMECGSSVNYPVIVVDNASPDDSVRQLAQTLEERKWTGWVRLLQSRSNGGFSAGNNQGIVASDSEFVLLLNSDTLVRPGAVELLMRFATQNPTAGLIGPRLEWPDGTPQGSAFRYLRPHHEFFQAAATGLLDKWFGYDWGTLPIQSEPHQAEWVSFACVLIRREVFERIGQLDDGFFMYFEDMDFCCRAREDGFEVWQYPNARVVHLRGGSSPVKKLVAERKRPPSYWYASRNRYYGKHFGSIGLWRANFCWYAGRTISYAREFLGLKRPHTNRSQWRDIWINSLNPLRRPKCEHQIERFPTCPADKINE